MNFYYDKVNISNFSFYKFYFKLIYINIIFNFFKFEKKLKNSLLIYIIVFIMNYKINFFILIKYIHLITYYALILNIVLMKRIS